jgi:large subunit ribosomal protein L19
MTNITSAFAAKHNPEPRFPDLRPGWTVRVHQKIAQGDKGKGRKSQIFEGIIVSRKHGNEAGATITVRRTVGVYGVEKSYPLHLPTIEKIEVVKRSKVRRAKLYFLREKSAREIRRKTRTEMNAEKAAQLDALRTEQAEVRQAKKEATEARAKELEERDKAEAQAAEEKVKEEAAKPASEDKKEAAA